MCPVITEHWPRQFTLTWIGSQLVAWSWPNYRWLVCFFLIPILLLNLAFQSIRARNAASKKSVNSSCLDQRTDNPGGIYERELFHSCQPANSHEILDQ